MFDVKGLVCRLIGLSSEGKYFPYKSSLNKRKETHGRHHAHIWTDILTLIMMVMAMIYKTFSCS